MESGDEEILLKAQKWNFDDLNQIRELASGFLASARTGERHADVTDAYNQLSGKNPRLGSRDSLIQGALGFYLFAYHAEQTSGARKGELNPQEVQTATEAATRPLQDEHVRFFLYRLYDAPATYHYEDLVLHEVGITSFIVKSEHHERAVKLIKPWLFGDNEIALQTKGYGDKYIRLQTLDPNHRRLVPAIYWCRESMIVMELIRGETLLQRFQGDDRSSSEKLLDLSAMVVDLCFILKKCAELDPPISHGDITPSNMIVENSTGCLRLIDFGINYLLTREVGTIEDYLDSVPYLAPDIVSQKQKASASIEGDTYSIGVLIAECLLAGNPEALSVQAMVDSVYRKYYGIGAMLDDLVDPIAERRLLGIERNPELYSWLAAQLRADFEVAARVRADADAFRSRWWVAIPNTLVPGLLDFIRQHMPASKSSKELEFLPARSRLGSPGSERVRSIVASICVGCSALTLSLFTGYVVSSDQLLHLRIDYLRSDISDYAGRGVAMSCAIIAGKYYMTIFSDLSAFRLPGWAWLTARACGIAVWIPILYTINYDPSAWPICVAIGATLIYVNNRCWHRLIDRARPAVRSAGLHVSPLMEETATWLDGWRGNSLLCAVCLYFGAALIALDLLNDVWFFALLIALVLNGRIYIFNLLRDGPIMRSGLHRYVNGFRRALAWRTSTEQASVGLAPAGASTSAHRASPGMLLGDLEQIVLNLKADLDRQTLTDRTRQ